MDILKVFENNLSTYLTDMIGECQVEYRNDSGIRFTKKLDTDVFVLQVHIHKEYNYAALTNILLPPSMKRKGVSISIINFILYICKETELSLYVTEIANESWMDSLIKHGGLLDNDGDVLINDKNWELANQTNDLRFIEFEDELILTSELEWYSNLKKQCITEVKNIFDSWNAEIDIRKTDKYIKQILATKNNITYLVKFKYLYVIKMAELIKDNELESYIKDNIHIGAF